MKKAIISFNTCNNLSHNALSSVKNACDRWNADHIMITKPLQPDGFHDMFTKIYLPKVVLNYDRSIYLDTDIIINTLAPNPFDIFNNNELIYVVKDMQQSFISEYDKLQFKINQLCMPWYDECKRVLSIDVNPTRYMNNFFNAGMFLFSPKNHQYIFRNIQDSLPMILDKYKQIHQVEQALLNYAFIYFLQDKLTYIPQEWNYIDPPIHLSSMKGFIYHFTGWHYKQYKEKINDFILWKKQ